MGGKCVVNYDLYAKCGRPQGSPLREAPLLKGLARAARLGDSCANFKKESLHRYAVPLPLTREAYIVKS